MKSAFTNTQKDVFLVVAAAIFLTFSVWLPHILSVANFSNLDFSKGIGTIYKNFDGLEYIIIAKSLYDPQVIASLPQPLPAQYFPSHFPGYSLAILALAPFTGYLKSMLISSLVFTILSAVAFYFLLKDLQLSKHPLYMSLLFLLLPARWVVVHSVGSAEPMFILFVILAIHAFIKYESTEKSKFLWAASVSGALAQITRPPGILLFIALSLYVLWKMVKVSKLRNIHILLFRYIARYSPLLLIPVTLLAVFAFFAVRLNDFYAYFHTGDNIHLMFPPYQVFDKYQPWVGDIWLEDIIFILLLTLLGGLVLIKQRLLPIAFFVITYFTATIFIAHRDISRYILPTFPFVLIAFEGVVTSKEFKIALAVIIPAVYLYAQNFILHNTAPYPSVLLFD